MLASAALLALYARGGDAAWVLGFVALVPWLRSLDSGSTATSAWRTLASALAMSTLLTAAMFWWFGLALARYVELHGAIGLLVLVLLAPLFQPQVWVFALVRLAARRRFGPLAAALAGSAAWVATEWTVPKLLGDTLGHGLYPAALLRQAADLGGAAGLTLLLLWSNEALCAAWAAWPRRAQGWRTLASPLLAALLVPLLLAAYGLSVPHEPPTPAASGSERLSVGLVQSNIVDYERLRRERGTAAVVREVLDLHYAMSYDAVERQRAQALLWSETVYPTTFGRPKSDAGAELDREILGIVDAARVPLVFGTYDRDPDGAGAGEYNAAAFVAPGRGLVGVYRKTRLFPLTEALPAWLDRPSVRQWLPWAGTWRPGDGARVFPLHLADGREVPVLPLICLDDVDTGLAIDGARLGAQLILTMSNDSWFTDHEQGARLHQAVAAFRSIETRLPQFRVTSNGYSAVIDARGQVLAGTRMGERTLVVGELPVREPPRTLMVAWGDWVGRAAALGLLLLAAWAAGQALRARTARPAAPGHATTASVTASVTAAGSVPLSMQVYVLSPAVRAIAGALRLLAYGSLAWLALSVLRGEGALASNSLAQLRAFVALVLAPEVAALGLLWASRATLSLQGEQLVLERGTRRTGLALQEVVAVRAWRLSCPAPGVSLQLRSGLVWSQGLARVDPMALQAAIATAQAVPAPAPDWAARHAQTQLAARGSRLLQHPVSKFLALPFLLAIPAFRLHQHIAFGGSLGELQLFGLGAFAKGFVLWWAAWVIGVVMVAALLRALIEGVMALVAMAPSTPLASSLHTRQVLEGLGLALLYLGIPLWLAWRLLAA